VSVWADLNRLSFALRRADVLTGVASQLAAHFDLATDADGRGRVAKLVAMARDEAQNAVGAATAALTALAGFEPGSVS